MSLGSCSDPRDTCIGGEASLVDSCGHSRVRGCALLAATGAWLGFVGIFLGLMAIVIAVVRRGRRNS